jgi:YggT family protein
MNDVREKVAEFLSALIWVYSLCIIAWIVVQFGFALGLRMPWSRPVNAVLDFLRDVTNPFLRIFRRLGLQFGPIDFSPIVAILVLQVGGNILVRLIDPAS